jgi:hypothetical protein
MAGDVPMSRDSSNRETPAAMETDANVCRIAYGDHELRDRGRVPDGHAVFLGTRESRDDQPITGGLVFTPLNFESALGQTTGYAFTMSIDHFVVQVLGSGKAGNYAVDVIEHGAVQVGLAVQIWPSVTRDVTWPPAGKMDDALLGEFARLPLASL